MASVDTRLRALETVVNGRWGEYDIPGDVAGESQQVTPPADVAELAEIVKEVRQDMSKLTDAFARLVTETAEMGSALDAYKAQTDATIALLRENAADPDAVNQIADTLQAYQDRLGGAVVANTGAGGEPQVLDTPPAATVDPVNAEPTPEETAAASSSVGVEVPPETPVA